MTKGADGGKASFFMMNIFRCKGTSCATDEEIDKVISQIALSINLISVDENFAVHTNDTLQFGYDL